MTNQITPDGNLTYNKTGNNSFVDSNGKTVNVPQFTATTTLSPQQQAIKAQTDQASLNLGTLANQQSAALSDQLSKPFSYTTSDAENYAYNLGKQRLDPQFAQQTDAMRSQLIASGLRPGTAAYDQQMTQLGQTKNDAYNQLALGAQQQGFNQALTTYNEPLNAISALMSGSQIQNPTFTSTPQTSVAGADYIGASNNNYQAQVKNQQATMGGLFGLASAGIGLLSDVRAKDDIKRVGWLDNGLPVYSYRYKGGDAVQIGLMAQEVEQVNPAAVIEKDGVKYVRYDLATENA